MSEVGGITTAEALAGAERAVVALGATGVNGADVTVEMVMEWIMGVAEAYQRGR